MQQYVVPFTNAVAMVPFGEFFGYNTPYYLDIMMEFGEDRDKLTHLIGNAIVQRNVHNIVEFREMIFMGLGYMGIDPEETVFYEKMVQFIRLICLKCSPLIIGTDLKLIEAFEDADWVNIIYRETSEPVLCNIQPSIDLTNSPGFQGIQSCGNSMPVYSGSPIITK
jgi:hypothetical protein